MTNHTNLLRRLILLSVLLSLVILTGRTSAQESVPQAQDPDGLQGANSASQPAPNNDKPPLLNGLPSEAPTFVAPSVPSSDRPGTRFQSSPDAPAINIWYGSVQNAGGNGDQLKWVNILGNVTPVNPSLLTYSLNGKPPVSLRVGPDKRRLLEPGDFNVELNYTELNQGANQITIVAEDSQGDISQAIVTVNYQGGAVSWTPPQTVQYDWSKVSRIDEIARVVDGDWAIESGQIYPTVLGYDRLIGLGDLSWQDYTVTVPITILGIDDNGYKTPSNGPGIGILARWQGHFDSGVVSPVDGWQRLGTLAWYRWERKLVNQEFQYSEGLQAYRYGGLPNDALTQARKLDFNTTYIFKLSVTSSVNPGQPATYRFKVWDASLPSEPAAWDMEYAGKTGEPLSGGILLVAHHVDARFGKAVVELADTLPPPVLTVSKTGSGAGNVALSPSRPNNTYRFGEDVKLTPQPAEGSIFSGWLGSLTGKDNPAYLEMFANKSVTATFSQANGQGPVSDDFSQCALGGQWSYIDPLGDATLTMTGTSAEISVPAGVTHDIWTNNKNAPRIMQSIDDGDFELDVKFESPLAAKYQLQGVLVEQNSDNFLRFGFQHDGNTLRLSAFTILNNSATTRLDQAITISPPMYLRVNRTGDTWTLLYSADGASWTNAAQFDFVLTAGSVGVYAGNAGPNPATTSEIDYFFNTASPISPEDKSRTLEVSTIGSGVGSVQVFPSKASYDCGDEVTLTAIPADNSRFVGWSGDLAGSTNPGTVIMDASKEVTAEFALDNGDGFVVNVTVNGNGSVTKTPDKPSYQPGEQVTLQAIPNDGNTFAGWSGDLIGNTNPVVITVNSDRAIAANFSQIFYTLQLTVDGPGEVLVNPTGTQFAAGTEITLTALPISGASFVGWSGAIQGSTTPQTLLMNGNKTVKATFSDGNPQVNMLYLPAIIR